MDRRTSVEISNESYLDLLPHGRRSGYIRFAVDARLAVVRAAIDMLRETRTDTDIVELVAEAARPAARMSESSLSSLGDAALRAVSTIWSECEATGLSAPDILAARDSGRTA